MENILKALAEGAHARAEAAKAVCPVEIIKERALKLARSDTSRDFAFEKALSRKGMSFICECKKASPSKGIIEPDYRWLETAVEYEAAGADCISVLTEPSWFMGSAAHLYGISQSVGVPCLRKDFTVDEYMIYEARLLGASAVLLICSLLTDRQIREFTEICDTLGMTALTETHDETEVRRALEAGARVIGVNNRNLRDFTVDTENSIRLRRIVPDNVIFVAESGVSCREDVRILENTGADAVLVGETLMKARDRKAKLHELRYGS